MIPQEVRDRLYAVAVPPRPGPGRPVRPSVGPAWTRPFATAGMGTLFAMVAWLAATWAIPLAAAEPSPITLAIAALSSVSAAFIGSAWVSRLRGRL